MLSDYWPHGVVGKAYGVFNEERGIDGRSAFVIDKEGVIRHTIVCAAGTIPESKELLDKLRAL